MKMVLVNEISCAVCGGGGGMKERKYMRRQLYPLGVEAMRATLIWRVFIRGAKLTPASRSHSGRYYTFFFRAVQKGGLEGCSRTNHQQRKNER
jgi:hypothetical protein